MRLVLLALMLTLVIGCSSNHAIVGKWSKSDGTTFEFFPDKTISVDPAGGFAALSGKWEEVTGDRIKLTMGMFSVLANYKVEGETLTWQEEGRRVETFSRAKS